MQWVTAVRWQRDRQTVRVASLLVRSTDPGEAAYFKTLRMVRDFRDKHVLPFPLQRAPNSLRVWSRRCEFQFLWTTSLLHSSSNSTSLCSGLTPPTLDLRCLTLWQGSAGDGGPPQQPSI